jgi:Fuc2NAc and GlcNAc transferase
MRSAYLLFSVFFIFFLSAFLTWFVRRYALQKSILDIPNERSSHHRPTPRGGGIAIVITFLLVVLGLGALKVIESRLVWTLVGGGLGIAVIGFCDDVFTVKARWRFFLHFLVAIWTIYWLGNLHSFHFGAINLVWNSIISLLTLFGIIWCINFYNFMDGIDGLAGSEGLFVALISAIALTLIGANQLALVLWLLSGAIAGFNLWNWPPAKIFMGDVGSGFLGFVFAALGVYSINQKYLPLTYWWIVLAVFICDATFTLLSRIYQGKKWYNAHREHAYQHATIYGFTHKHVSTSIIVINCCVLMPLAFATLYWPNYSLWFVSAAMIGLALTWVWVKSWPLPT